MSDAPENRSDPPGRPRRRLRVAALLAVAAVGLVAVAAGCGGDDEAATAGDTSAATAPAASGGAPATPDAEQTANIERILAFDEAGVRLETPARIGYLPECVTNPYCQARMDGLRDAAEKFGFTFETFDGNFSAQTQLKAVQDATTKGFDGYILGPTVEAAGCTMWRDYLVPTGRPVVTVDIPMCGDADHTPDTAGAVLMQSQAYFDAHVDNAFASCEDTCKAVAIGGFVGSDLYNYWQNAIEKAEAKYPNVEVVVNQPGDFDPRKALQITRDALAAHPDVNMVVVSWDDMTRGVPAGITAAGKTPGEDVEIYTVGATKDAIAKLKSGVYSESTMLLPYEEAYYAGVAMAMALRGEPLDGFVNQALLPKVTEGAGTIFITPENADSHEPNY